MRELRGRHRAGGPVPLPYVPGVFDVLERTAAADLTNQSSGWLVVWGAYWRCWSAYARFGKTPLVVHASDVAALLAGMREAERAARGCGW